MQLNILWMILYLYLSFLPKKKERRKSTSKVPNGGENAHFLHSSSFLLTTPFNFRLSLMPCCSVVAGPWLCKRVEVEVEVEVGRVLPILFPLPLVIDQTNKPSSMPINNQMVFQLSLDSNSWHRPLNLRPAHYYYGKRLGLFFRYQESKQLRIDLSCTTSIFDGSLMSIDLTHSHFLTIISREPMPHNQKRK